MKPKGFCQECGHLVAKKKLHKSKQDRRILCGNCYRLEQEHIFNSNKALGSPDIEILNDYMEIPRSVMRVSLNKQYNNRLLRGEDIIIKKKYGYDTLSIGNKKCKQLRELKKAIYNTQLKKELSEKLAKQIPNKDKNKKFLDGLYG